MVRRWKCKFSKLQRMKKFLLPLFVCGIFVIANAQPIGPKKNTTKSNKEADANPVINETEKWVITPLAAMTDGIGKLSIIIPKDTTVYIFDKWITIPLFIRDTVRRVQPGSMYYSIIELPKYLETANYMSISLSGVKFSVPIRSGKETRLKAGYLSISKKKTDTDFDDWTGDLFDTVYGSNDFPDETWVWTLYVGNTKFTGKKSAIFALPPGVYTVVKKRPSDNKTITYKATVIDGQWVKNGVKQVEE